MFLGRDLMKTALQLHGPPSPNLLPRLIMKSHRENPHWGAFYKIPDQGSSKLQGHHKQAKSKKLSQPRAAQGHMTARSAMESWLRRALRKN